jgi:hypothetical protein
LRLPTFTLKLLLLGHLYRAIYLTRDIFDTGESSSLENQPFVTDSTLVPDELRGSKALQSIASWFDRPHLKRGDRPAPWVYHCPIAPALASVLGWEDPQKFAETIAQTVQKGIPGDHPILGELRISVGDGGWLSFDVQGLGVLAWLAGLEFVDPLLWSIDRSTHTLDLDQLWVCQHHHARLNRLRISSTPCLPKSEWELLGAFLDTIDQLEGLNHPLNAPLALKLAHRLARESDRSLVGGGGGSFSNCPLTQLQAKTQQLIAWLLVEGCGQIAPSRL